MPGGIAGFASGNNMLLAVTLDKTMVCKVPVTGILIGFLYNTGQCQCCLELAVKQRSVGNIAACNLHALAVIPSLECAPM